MGKIICIDAGHGGSDSGAVGNGVIEKNVALNAVLSIGELLKKQGFDVIYTRNSDVYVNLNERCRIANFKNVDLFISVHINSATNTNAKGTETLCYSKNKFAEIVQKNLISVLKTNDRGLKERKDLAVLNGTKMTAVLLELGFLSNKDEANLIKSSLFIDNVTTAVVKSVCLYFGVTFKGYANDDYNTEKGKSIMEKDIEVVVEGEKRITKGYFINGKNLFTAEFIRSLGFYVSYDADSKVVSFKRLKVE